MSKYTGTLRADFSVDSDGGACYLVPIDLPPGTANMMPILSVGYNSGGGNDVLGMGWSLRGLSSITRAPRTVAQDDLYGSVAYSIDDRFALDGQRLVPVSGTQGAADAVYHTEIESWTKVIPVYYGQNGNPQPPVPGRSGPDAFVATDKDGKVHEYGTASDAQVVASASNPGIRVWALNKITDRYGNTVTFSYDLDLANNAFYPSQIAYTGNEAAGLMPQRSVIFHYETRPPGADAVPRCQAGYPVTTTRRMTAIETQFDGATVHTYAFAYETGAVTGRSRLLSITKTDAEGISLEPTTFHWQEGGAGLLSKDVALTGASLQSQGVLLPMDVNGDGRIDLVNASSSGGMLELTILISDGTGFSSPVTVSPAGVTFGRQPILPLDVNGDGCTDLVVAGADGGFLTLQVLTAAEDDGGWTFVPGSVTTTSLLFGGQLVPMDVDGDGLVDLVYAYDDGGTRLAVFFSDGSIFGDQPLICDTPATLSDFAGAQLVPIDFNGDGMTDLVCAEQDGDNLLLTLFLSAGRSGLVEQQSFHSPENLTVGGALMGMDVNSDGIGDLVHASIDESGLLIVQTLLSNGVSFEALATQSFALQGGLPASVLPMELNGDGLPDLLVAIPSLDETQVVLQALLSTGAGFEAAAVTSPSSNVPWGATLLPVDFDGDGRTDLVYIFQTGEGFGMRAMTPTGAFPDLIDRIVTGIGGLIEPMYAPLTDPAVYARAVSVAPSELDVGSLVGTGVSGATVQVAHGTAPSSTPGFVPASRVVDFPKYVLSGYIRGDGRGSAYRYLHTYAGARLGLTGRGWLGFESSSATDVSQGTTSETIYNQAFPWTHTPASSKRYVTDGGALMQTQSWVYDPPAPTPGLPPPVPPAMPCSPHPVQRQTALYTFGALDSTETAVFAYDEYGNVLVTAESSTDSNSAPLWTTNTFQNDPDIWRLGFCTGTKVTADEAGAQVLAWTTMIYYPQTWALHSQSAWDDLVQAWEVSTFGYDAFGNETSVTDPSGAITTMTFDPTYHTFPQTVASPEHGTGGSLISSFVYYPAFGVLQQSTDPNGVVTGQLVDGLGRVTATTGPGPSGSTVTMSTHTWGVDVAGALEDEIQVLADWSLPTWHFTRRFVDGMGRVIRTVRLGPDGSTALLVDRVYDSRGRVLTQTLPYYLGQTPAYVVNVYDAYGRLSSTTRPPADAQSEAVMTSFSYPTTAKTVQVEADGTSDARTTTVTYCVYSGKRCIVESVDADGAVGTFVYDPLGRLLSATDQAACHEISYDTLGRRYKVTVASPGDQTAVWFAETVSYDDIARTVTQTDAAGNVVVWAYDPLRRPASKVVNGGTPTTYLYDDLQHANAQGRCCAVVLPDGSRYDYDYDPNGNQSTITLTLDGTAYTMGRTHTPGGAVAQLTFPDGATLTNNYNGAGSLVSVVQDDSGADSLTCASYTSFDALGHAGVVTLGNGTTEARTFDQLGRPSTLAVTDTGGTVLVSQRYHWSDLDLLGVLADELTAANTETFGFDPVGRLESAVGPYRSEAFKYDGAGNLTTKDDITFKLDGYQAASGTVAGQEVMSAAYDPVGSMTSITRNGVTTAYRYDGERRLLGAAETTFAYDHTGRRLKKQSPDGTTTYYVAPYYEVVAFPDGGRQHTRYVLGDAGVVMTVTAADVAGGTAPAGVPVPGTCYLHRNYLRSTVEITDASGAPITSLAYLPFGEVSTVDGPDVVRPTFTGKELDAETSLYYFNARYYDPALGRFITADDRLSPTRGRLDGLNLYAYGLNDPTSRTDPTGHFSVSSLWHDVEHGVGVVGHTSIDAHSIGKFFSNDVGTFFAHHWQEVAMITVDASLVVGGVAMLTLTPFTGPTSTYLGEAMLGAGVGGLAYNVTQLASHQQSSWRDWGIQIGVGALTGAIGAGAGQVGDFAVGMLTTRVSTFASEALKSVLVNGAKLGLGGVANAVASVGGQFAQNVLTNTVEHHHILKGAANGMGWGALMGFGTGGLASAVSGTLASDIERNEVDVEDAAAHDMMAEVLQRRGIEPTHFISPRELSAVQKLAVEVAPDLLISWAADAALTSIPSWPQW